MALTSNDRLILVAILAIVMTVVVFFELRVIRRKSKVQRLSSQKKDEAYNDILTTRSVLNALKNQGKSTGNAQYYLDHAKSAMNRGDFENCDAFCSKARDELIKPSKDKLLPGTSGGKDEADELEQVAESILSESMPPADANSYKGTKLSSGSEGNYLGAKFEISAAKGDISRAAKSGFNVSAAETLMVRADSAFAGGNYDKALAFASRARRAINKGSAEETIPLKAGPDVSGPGSAPGPEVYDVEEEITPSGMRCPNCGTLLDPTDRYCANCGASTSKNKTCKSCGAIAKPVDTFCRKCGSRIA